MHADAKSACCMPAQAAAVAHWRVGHCPLQLLQLNRAIYSRKLNALKLHETSFRQYKTKPIFMSWSDHVHTPTFVASRYVGVEFLRNKESYSSNI